MEASKALEWIDKFISQAPYAAWLIFGLVVGLILLLLFNGIIIPWRKSRVCPHCGKLYKEKAE